MRLLLGVLALVCAAVRAQECEYPPVVLMHGIMGAADKLQDVVDWIKEDLPCVYVRSIEIGNGPNDSLYMHMNDQVASFCEQIYADPQLSRGFNLIGFSQGGLISRGYIQRCNKYPVINFMSWASPQGGQFGGLEAFFPNWLYVLLNSAPYSDQVQNTYSLAQYWRDPYNLQEYLEKSSFLADMNNERINKNATYKENIMSLKNMVLLYSDVDYVVTPPRSGWFETFKPYTGPGPDGEVISLRDSLLYKLDYIGLKALDDSGRLQLHISDCAHEDHPTNQCKHIFDLYTLPLLQQRWSEVEGFWNGPSAANPLMQNETRSL
eukprot:m.254942 g.254942  ORF g.254942 m.254942 type:complete len:321 (-) comp18889_c0_seq1:111-1073(-)